MREAAIALWLGGVADEPTRSSNVKEHVSHSHTIPKCAVGIPTFGFAHEIPDRSA